MSRDHPVHRYVSTFPPPFLPLVVRGVSLPVSSVLSPSRVFSVPIARSLLLPTMMLMRPDMFSFTYPNGEPQTPTKTPSSAALDSFTTPKLESSFFDPRVTWDTADP